MKFTAAEDLVNKYLTGAASATKIPLTQIIPLSKPLSPEEEKKYMDWKGQLDAHMCMLRSTLSMRDTLDNQAKILEKRMESVIQSAKENGFFLHSRDVRYYERRDNI